MSARRWARVAVGMLALAAAGGGCGKEPKTSGPRRAEVLRAVSAAANARGHDPSHLASDEAFVIRLARGSRFGSCPVYAVEIRQDGTIAYDGHTFVGRRGRATAKIAPSEVAALAQRMSDAGFLSMTWKNPCDVVSTVDAPTRRPRSSAAAGRGGSTILAATCAFHERSAT